MQTAHAGIHGLLSDPAWRRDAARSGARTRVQAALKSAAINAGLAARGEAHAARALAALGQSPSLYTATGALGATSAAQGVSAYPAQQNLAYLGVGNQAGSVANQNAQLGLNQANMSFNQNQTLGSNLGAGMAGLGNQNNWNWLSKVAPQQQPFVPFGPGY